MFIIGIRKGWEEMKVFLNIIAAILIPAGGVWILQGINILPGSFMTGQIKWAIYGAISLVIGVGVLIVANRKK
jgi:hypothetical protein